MHLGKGVCVLCVLFTYTCVNVFASARVYV